MPKRRDHRGTRQSMECIALTDLSARGGVTNSRSVDATSSPLGPEISPQEIINNRSKRQMNVFAFYLVRTRGLEPPQPFGHYHLKVARLPIPPRPLIGR